MNQHPSDGTAASPTPTQPPIAECDLAAHRHALALLLHELRTPLLGILGMADLMRGQLVDPAARSRLAVIHQCGQQLFGLLEDLMTLARFAESSLELELGEVAPGRLCAEVADTLGPMASAKHLALGIVMRPSVPATVIADPKRLRQVLLNLVTNAIKFTRRGSVTLETAVEPAEASRGARLVFRVVDTGVGLSKNGRLSLDQLFAGGPEHLEPMGFGLGLEVCRRLAKLMEADLDLTSSPGEGTTATFSLPLAVAP